MEAGYPDLTDIAEDECCICGSLEIKTVDPFGYPFCEACDIRAWFLARGRATGWPALRIDGVTGKYAIDNSDESWVLTALCGTIERVAELFDALDEYEASQRKAS